MTVHIVWKGVGGGSARRSNVLPSTLRLTELGYNNRHGTAHWDILNEKQTIKQTNNKGKKPGTPGRRVAAGWQPGGSRVAACPQPGVRAHQPGGSRAQPGRQPGRQPGAAGWQPGVTRVAAGTQPGAAGGDRIQ